MKQYHFMIDVFISIKAGDESDAHEKLDRRLKQLVSGNFQYVISQYCGETEESEEC